MFLDPEISYQQIENSVEEVCLKLKQLKPNQIVAYLGSNPAEYWVTFLACKKLDLILFMPNQRLAVSLQNKILKNLEPSCLITQNFVVEFKSGKNYESSGVIVQTSGSSGTPKFCLISFEALDHSAETVANYFNLQPDQIWQLNLPCYHVGGLGILNRCYLRKARVSLNKELNGNYKTIISIVPSFLKDFEKLKAYKTILVGGSSVSVDLSRKLSNDYDNIFFSYGLTEFSSTVAIGKISNQLKFLPNVEAKVDKEILYLKGNSRFTEYLGTENVNAEFFKTSDRATYNSGDLHVLGRLDRVINSGGEKISPEMIENLLNENFRTKLAVLKENSRIWGERPILVHEQDLNVYKVRELIEEKLGKIFIPDRFIQTRIPVIGIGKINYPELQRNVTSGYN